MKQPSLFGPHNYYSKKCGEICYGPKSKMAAKNHLKIYKLNVLTYKTAQYVFFGVFLGGA